MVDQRLHHHGWRLWSVLLVVQISCPCSVLILLPATKDTRGHTYHDSSERDQSRTQDRGRLRCFGLLVVAAVEGHVVIPLGTRIGVVEVPVTDVVRATISHIIQIIIIIY